MQAVSTASCDNSKRLQRRRDYLSPLPTVRVQGRGWVCLPGTSYLASTAMRTSLSGQLADKGVRIQQQKPLSASLPLYPSSLLLTPLQVARGPQCHRAGGKSFQPALNRPRNTLPACAGGLWIDHLMYHLLPNSIFQCNRHRCNHSDGAHSEPSGSGGERGGATIIRIRW